jgi:hypothetical protein
MDESTVAFDTPALTYRCGGSTGFDFRIGKRGSGIELVRAEPASISFLVTRLPILYLTCFPFNLAAGRRRRHLLLAARGEA